MTDQTDQAARAPKRGALPSPRSALAAAVPHVARVGAPPTFLTRPQRISMWGNDVHGDCVTAEEAFAKACNNPEIFVSDDDVIEWAKEHGVLEGAYLTDVMSWMQQYGFVQGSQMYVDGGHFSVNWNDDATLRSAIALGPVKLGIAADQIETAWQSTGGRTGWFGTGFHPDAGEDHCVALCGYGSLTWLAQQFGVSVPAGVDGSQPGYALFTWNSIGIIDVPSMRAITHEAWLRQPTTIVEPTATGDTMAPGQILLPGEAVHSADGRYTFVYQGDGNLVLYDGGHALWASNTYGRPAGVCVMQGDGNLVIYPPNGGNAIWSSGTYGNPGSHLVVQGDGNVVIYQPNGHPIWSTNTWLPTGPTATGDTMQPGQVLNPGNSITSASGRYRFVYQGDGNLVLYDGGQPLWASNTNGRPVGICIMQGDGNLVIYARGGHPIWASGTNGNANSRLVAQDDGNVVIYQPGGHPVWSTNTWLPSGPTATGDTMQPGQVLNPGNSITSADGRFRFVYQGDGNLVLYQGNQAPWASGTNGRGVGVCVMQGDGNLVIYLRGGHPIWASNTDGNPGSHLIVQNDRNVVIYRPNGSPAWATGTNI
ncbi:hypothetical protein [Microlunatus ginsengisoli]|uniref:Bulb-type lectin domain-containing protein n=1 Tax=Microlunatus ginsengisoli TaxID=363863 RepID=A0ABP7A8B1_9ACTN